LTRTEKQIDNLIKEAEKLVADNDKARDTIKTNKATLKALDGLIVAKGGKTPVSVHDELKNGNDEE